jgi:hypothetical protein
MATKTHVGEAVWVGDRNSQVQLCNSSGAVFHEGTQLSATAAEINAVADASNRIVNLITTTACTKATHANKICLLSLATGFTVTLPEATGTGDIYTFKVGIVRTSNAYIIAALTTDTMSGFAFIADTDTTDNAEGFAIGGTDDKLSLNATTTGGLTIGDTIRCIDAQNTVWHVECFLTGSGDLATPGSAT